MGLLVSKLTGKIDPAKVLQYAPGELVNLPVLSTPRGPQSGQSERFRRHPTRQQLHQGRLPPRRAHCIPTTS
ncbi:LpqN/LpqT family lipoprotein [Mycobacterium sp.]|uniref:LpqN/LpqT family lipoprotein n=1 Tax=Mycobacterium sp. TaxID=1785 RepID=UPI003F9BB137